MDPVLWIFNEYIGLPPAPGGVRHVSLARGLRDAGWRVCLITATWDEDTAAPRTGVVPPRRHVDLDGVQVVTLDVPEYEGNGARRVANMVSFGVEAAVPNATKGLPRPHVVIGSSVHPLAAAAAALHARRLRVPFVFEIRDLWPETFVRLGVLRQTSAVTRSMYRLERWLWERASLIVSPLGEIPAYEKDRRLPHRPFLHIPNGVDTAQFDPTPRHQQGALRLGYFGSHGLTDYLEVLVQALAHTTARARANEFEVHFYGNGPKKPELHALAVRLMIDNLHFHDPVDRAAVPLEMSGMDAFLFPLDDTNGLYRYGASPNKLQDYLAASRPIIMNAPFAHDPVRTAGGAGIIVGECTPAAWAQAFVQILATTDRERADMGARARLLAEESYDFRILAKRLDAGLRSFLGGAE